MQTAEKTEKAARPKQSELRQDWPKVRAVTIRGEVFYQVDARKTGTDGRRETFKILKDATKHAEKIGARVAKEGQGSLSFADNDRADARRAMEALKDFPRVTLHEAATFYRNHLLSLQAVEASATIDDLCKAWFAEKSSGSKRKLREKTITNIRQAHRKLIKAFGTRKIKAITTGEMESFLAKETKSLRGKFNLCSLSSQFFNWSKAKGKLIDNPCDPIEITPESKEIAIFTPGEAQTLLETCEKNHPHLILYFAISLFAGLRPEECVLLKWENVHLDEQTITVLAATSKTKETRNVHVEDTLLNWLTTYAPANAKGFVTPQENFAKTSRKLHVALGFKGDGKNMQAKHWPLDITRHSYGSYWLAKHGNRAQLAEYMGNSLQIIKKHYKAVVSKSACAAYWAILPAKTAASVKLHPMGELSSTVGVDGDTAARAFDAVAEAEQVVASGGVLVTK